MAIKTRETTADGVTNNNAPLTNAELDNNFVELQQNKIDSSGDSMTGNLSFGDSDKAIFGAGSDLQIYHDGDDSYIQDAGTGDLLIRGANVQITTAIGTKYFEGAANIARLYHTGNEKLATTSTGIDVTGDIKCDDLLTIDDPTGWANIEMGGGNGAYIDMKSPSSDDYDFRLQYYDENDKVAWHGSVLSLFYTEGVEYLRLNSSKLGVFNSAPTHELDIVGTIGNTNNQPTVRPVFNMDFVNAKTIDPRFHFERQSNGYYYDGKTTVLAENNIVRYSQTFNTNWNVSAAVTKTYSQSDPHGGTDAVKLTVSDSGSSRYMYSANTAIEPNTDYVVSFWVKNISATAAYLGILRVNPSVTWILDPASNSYYSQISTSSWTRVEQTFNSGTATSFYVYPYHTSTSNQNGSEILIFGVQIEKGTTAGAYIETTSRALEKYQPKLMEAVSFEPRFDHHPLTNEPRGLLLEGAGTNLMVKSEDPSGLYFQACASPSYETGMVAPDGTKTAIKFREDSSVGYHRVAHGIDGGWVNGRDYTVSFYAKAGERTDLRFNAGSAIAVGFTIDLTDGSTNDDNVEVEDVGNGWYRISCYGTAIVTAAYSLYIGGFVGGTDNYQGVEGMGFWLWGFQVEDYKKRRSSYIKTEGAVATRQPDYLSALCGTDIDVSSKEGTLYAEFEIDHSVDNSYPRIFSTDTMYFAGHEASNHVYFQVVSVNGYPDANTADGSFADGSIATPAVYKTAGSWEVGVGYKAAINGSVATTSDSAGELPFQDGERLMIGSSINTSTRAMNGWFKKAAYYSESLTSNELETITES